MHAHGGDIYTNLVKIDFSANINPFGLPETVKKALLENIEAFCAYPDSECEKLRRAIAEYESVSAENILCGNGASELIFNTVRAVMPKRALLIAPTFSEYERALKSVGCEIKYHTLSEENNFNLTEQILPELDEMDMIFLCNPNNPVGNIIDEALMDQILHECEKRDIFAVIDECFMDFVPNGYSAKKKTAVIKAFTKTHALAGLRLGYMIGDSKTLEKIDLVSPCWNVSAAAQLAGMAALSDAEYLEKTKKYIEKERIFLTDKLRKLCIKAFDSRTNFILFKTGKEIYAPLLEKGLLIRKCGNFRGLDNSFYRIAVRLPEENNELLSALKECL